MIDLMGWSKGGISKIADKYKKSTSRFGAMEAAVFERADLNVPIHEAKYVVIDTELTGLNIKKDSIISIGAVKMHGGKVFLGDTFYRLVSPGSELTSASIVIHGITPSDLIEKPGIDAVLPEFLDYCGDDVIVGFHPSLDLGFINREMKRLFGILVKNSVVDVFMTYKWIKQRMGEDLPDNASLYEIAKECGVPVKDAHNAISDAFITAQVLQRLLHTLSNLGIKSVGELLSVSNPPKGGGGFRLSTRFNNL